MSPSTPLNAPESADGMDAATSPGAQMGLRAQTVHDAGARAWMPAGLAGQAERTDWLAEECPVALVFNGISHAVMMCSPLDLEDFALGFGLSEGLLQHEGELLDIGVEASAQGLSVQLQVSAACEWRMKARRRAMAGRTGCGLCGVDSLLAVRRDLPLVPTQSVHPQSVQLALRALRQHQVLQLRSGATHAAALCDADGEILSVREDVGRHNALDKLIGAMRTAHMAPTDRFICITSRASFEMVQKAAVAGVGALVAVSAPTALAVDTAKALNMALAGFARGDAFVAYTHPDRFGVAVPGPGAQASPLAERQSP